MYCPRHLLRSKFEAQTTSHQRCILTLEAHWTKADSKQRSPSKMKVTHKQSKREMQPSIHLHIYKIPMWPLLNRLSHLPCPSFNIQFSLLYLLCLHSSPQPKLQYTIFTFIFICFTFTFYTPLFFNIIPMCLLFSWTCSPISPAQAPTASPFIPCFFPQAPPRRENVISSFLS